VFSPCGGRRTRRKSCDHVVSSLAIIGAGAGDVLGTGQRGLRRRRSDEPASPLYLSLQKGVLVSRTSIILREHQTDKPHDARALFVAKIAG
jgi:hypothetical protein